MKICLIIIGLIFLQCTTIKREEKNNQQVDWKCDTINQSNKKIVTAKYTDQTIQLDYTVYGEINHLQWENIDSCILEVNTKDKKIRSKNIKLDLWKLKKTNTRFYKKTDHLILIIGLPLGCHGKYCNSIQYALIDWEKEKNNIISGSYDRHVKIEQIDIDSLITNYQGG